MKVFTGNSIGLGQSSIRRCLEGIVFCLLILGAVPAVFGQVAQQLLGRVTDFSGAVVSNATITVTNEATGVLATTHTSQTGDWVVPYLSPGSYAVKVESS